MTHQGKGRNSIEIPNSIEYTQVHSSGLRPTLNPPPPSCDGIPKFQQSSNLVVIVVYSVVRLLHVGGQMVERFKRHNSYAMQGEQGCLLTEAPKRIEFEKKTKQGQSICLPKCTCVSSFIINFRSMFRDRQRTSSLHNYSLQLKSRLLLYVRLVSISIKITTKRKKESSSLRRAARFFKWKASSSK